LRTECISAKMSGVTDTSLGQLATALNDLYRLSGSARFHEQTVAATGVAITRTGLHFLSLVADTGPVSATRLAAGLDLSQPTASRVLQSLENEGLVARQADDKDGRVSHYVATAKGRRALDEVHRYHVKTLTQALGDVDPRRREALATAVTELVQRLHPDRHAEDRSTRRTA
jgi:DNA-binding MarR family transcriptional regulator